MLATYKKITSNGRTYFEVNIVDGEETELREFDTGKEVKAFLTGMRVARGLAVRAVQKLPLQIFPE